MRFHWWGSRSFSELELMQVKISNEILHGATEVILGGEHPAIITLGRRAQTKEIRSSQISFQKCDRGGLATLHSPGQLVIYPLIHLRQRGWGVRDYVMDLLQVSQRTLTEVGVDTDLEIGTKAGLFTARGKIGFCGIQVSRGVSRFGIAINVSNDLSLFSHLRPCGRDSQVMDRLQDCSSTATINSEQLFALWMNQFNKLIEDSKQHQLEHATSLLGSSG